MRRNRRNYEDYEEPAPRKAKRVVDPLANSINAASNEASGIFTAINHDMKKAMMALKRGDFQTAILAAGQSAAVCQNLSRTLLQFEDLIHRMKQREEFKAEQIRLIEAGEFPVPHSKAVQA